MLPLATNPAGLLAGVDRLLEAVALPEAKGREAAAEILAAETELPLSKIAELLRAMPRVSPTPAIDRLPEAAIRALAAVLARFPEPGRRSAIARAELLVANGVTFDRVLSKISVMYSC